MKKIFNIKFLAFIGAVAFFGSCTDLVSKEEDSIPTNAAGGCVTSSNVKESLVSAYKDLGSYTDQANIYSLGEHTSGEMIPPTRGVDWGDNGVWRTLDQHTLDATHSWNLNAWNQLNQMAFKCGVIIGTSGATPLQIAEAKFLRAFHMTLVMDYWGQVPIRQPCEGVDVNPTVMTRAVAFDFIMKDLTDALPNLPKIGPGASNGAASKASANLLIAKLLLNKAVYKAATSAGPYTFDKADMTAAIAAVDAVKADGYDLEDNYWTNYTAAASKEVAFVSLEGTPQNRWFMTLHYDQDPSGWNGFTTLVDYYNKMSAADQRLGVTPKKDKSAFAGIGKGFLRGQQYKGDGTILVDSRTKKPLSFTDDIVLAGAATDKGIRYIKYHPADANKYVLQRYGEGVLIKAEAQLRGGDAAGALLTINALRVKRGAALVTTVDADALFDEIGREMMWDGQKRTHEVRFGKYITGPGVVNKDPGSVLFPIPVDAVTTNPNLKQNAGYK